MCGTQSLNNKNHGAISTKVFLHVIIYIDFWSQYITRKIRNYSWDYCLIPPPRSNGPLIGCTPIFRCDDWATNPNPSPYPPYILAPNNKYIYCHYNTNSTGASSWSRLNTCQKLKQRETKFTCLRIEILFSVTAAYFENAMIDDALEIL